MKNYIAILLSVLLTACGGGGDSPAVSSTLTTYTISKFSNKTGYKSTVPFKDEKFFLDLCLWDTRGLDIEVSIQGSVTGNVATAEWMFNVPYANIPGSRICPGIYYGWRDTLFYSGLPEFKYMNQYKPAGILPSTFKNLPEKLFVDYDIQLSNTNGSWHITSEAWGMNMWGSNTNSGWYWNGASIPMDIHYWGTPEWDSNYWNDERFGKPNEIFTDSYGRRWRLTKAAWHNNCGNGCPNFPYTIVIDLIDGKLKDKVDVKPVINRVIQLGWQSPDLSLSNLGINTEVIYGNATVTVNKFEVTDK